jgi:hypothetical protein
MSQETPLNIPEVPNPLQKVWRAGTWMEARFETREAAEGYRRVLAGEIGPATTIQAPRRFVETQGSGTRKKARI